MTSADSPRARDPSSVDPGVECDGLLQGARRCGHREGGCAVVAVQHLLGGCGELEEALHMRQSRLGGQQCRCLARLGIHLVDLAHLVRQQIELSLPVARCDAECLDLRQQSLLPLERLSIGNRGLQVGRAREPVQEGRLGAAGEQTLGLVLTVDLDQVLAEGGQGGGCGELSGDPGRSLAVGGNGPGQDQLVVVGPLASIDVDGAGIDVDGRIEPRLHPGRPGSLADE